MKKYILLLILFASCKSVKRDIFLKPEEISWNNYKGAIPDISDYTAYTIFIVKPNDTIPEVEILFSESQSWAKKKDISEYDKEDRDLLLKHEVYHYKIGIIGAKMLLGDLKKLHTYSRDSVVYLSNHWNNVTEFKNRSYDRACGEGLNPIKQQMWCDMIDKKLDSLKGYKLLGE